MLNSHMVCFKNIFKYYKEQSFCKFIWYVWEVETINESYYSYNCSNNMSN